MDTNVLNCIGYEHRKEEEDPILLLIYRPSPSKKNKFSDFMFSISFPTFFFNTLTVCLAKRF